MTLRNLPYILLLILLVAGFGCSSSNTDAPSGSATTTHLANWLSLHGAEAKTDLRGCQGCHGFDFTGSGNAVSCFTCHTSGPPFVGAHPAFWNGDAYNEHQHFSNTVDPTERLSWTTCAVSACHGTDLKGGTSGPSCFSTTFTNGNGQTRSCHSTGNPPGNPPAPHNIPYSAPGSHGAEAKDISNINENMGNYCIHCHGRPPNTFDGGFIGDANILNKPAGTCSASSCHPAAEAHWENWQGTNDDTTSNSYFSTHRTVSQQTIDGGCAVCHKTTAAGAGPKPGAPSCFSSTFTNANSISTNCHPSGPGVAPHAVDGSYRDAANHGKDAKADLTNCQSCHGEPGGAGTNPRFNVAIGSLANGCETCHDPNYAHPTNWAGPNTSFHYSAGPTGLQTACGLCHGATLNGPGEGGVGVSCYTCHLSGTSFALNCTHCHDAPPTTTGHVTGATPVDHTPTLPGQTVPGFLTAHSQCSNCHGVSEGGTGLLSPLNSDYALFDKATDTLGDHWNDKIMMNGTTGADYDAASNGCNQACHLNDTDHQLSSSGLTLDYGGFGSGSGVAGCTGCHGYPPVGDGTTADPNDKHVAGATPVDHTPPTATPAAFLAAHEDCRTCHGTREHQTNAGTHDPHANYSVTTNHNSGQLEMNSAVSYIQTDFGCDNAGCHGNDADHQLSDSGLTVNDTLDFGGGGCGSCHDTGVNGAPVVLDSSPHSLAATGYTCQDCHTAHNSGTITIPNPPGGLAATLGLSYSDFENGISLGSATATGATEAEICWNCHTIEAVSEWGVNSDTNGAAPNYDFGSLDQSNWVGATWSSAVTGFAYKTGAVQSTHAASSAAGTGGGAARSGVDDVDAIRCSYCHDVHDTFGPNGKPYLRGSWMGSPYREDGAPRAGAAGVAPSLNLFGPVPRGGAAHTELGGYQIDQNNGNLTSGGTPAHQASDTDVANAGWDLANSASLCVLCHGNTVDSLDQYGTNDWVGTNGHSNAVIGGTGGNAANIFREATRRDTSPVPPAPTTTKGDNAGNPMMAYMQFFGNNTEGHGFRSESNQNRGFHLLPTAGNGTNRPFAWNDYDWGASVVTDQTDSQYHRFPCSKCHNPHASRLPRLMITNCLDTNHNTWDDPVASVIDPIDPAGTANQDGTSTISAENGDVTWSNSTSAQNCHRVKDSTGKDFTNKAGIPTGGWNTVTPWDEF